MARRRNRDNRKAQAPVSLPVPAKPSRPFYLSPEVSGRISLAALKYRPATSPASIEAFSPPSQVDFRSPGLDPKNNVNIEPFISRGPGRPAKDGGDRQTLPTVEDGRLMPGGWSQSAFIIKRPEPVEYSFENLKWGEANLYKVIPIAKKISPDLAQAVNLLKRLANTGLKISVKEFTGDGKEATKEDPIATQLIREVLEKAGQHVVADVPGAHGGLSNLIDQWIEDGFTLGSFSGELVLTKNRKDVFNIVSINPYTVQLRRDVANPGMFLIGQRRWDAPNGWLQLNPNLCFYQPMNGEIYGDSEFISSLQIIPLWMGYFGKLQIFLHRAAFGFLDGVVKVEILQQMWNQVPSEVRGLYDDDFMSWANAMVEYLANCYKEQGEADPDALLAHLDLLEVKGEATGKATFPTEEAQRVVKEEIYAGMHVPGELLGAKASTNDKFTAMKIEAYHAYLKFFQKKILEMLNRIAFVALQAMGYGKKIKPDITFNPIPIDDRLTSAQALQLEQLCAKFLRDENITSQNAMARELVGGPAIGPAPLSGTTDQDGPSAPDPEIVNPAPPGPADKASAGGGAEGGKGSYGGAKKGRDTNPTNDNKNK